MLHQSDAQRAVAVKNAGKLSPSDAAAVFEALVAQMERQDDLGAEKSALWGAFQWAETRTELRGQLVTACARLPEVTVPPAVVSRLAKLVQGGDAEAHAKQLFTKWGRSTANKNLSIAAKRQA